jgi:hypothetical protein
MTTAPPKPGWRVLTQNLITSADFALNASKPDWSAVQDLATLIDTFCLCDGAVALGRGIVDHSSHTGMGEFLETSGFLSVQHPDDSTGQEISVAAKRHLLTYLGANAPDDEAFDKLIQFGLTPNAAVNGLTYNPDRRQEVEVGSEWLKTTPSTSDILDRLRKEKNETRGTTFVVRSFLYLAYSEITGYLLVPDATRIPVIGGAVAAEQEVRQQILQTLQKTSSGARTALTERVSPFAAVVFQRAEGNRRKIPAQMDLMRAELAPLRRRLRSAEQKIFYGEGDEVADAVNEWDRVNKEISRSFGTEPHLISVEGILGLGRTGADAVDSPLKAKSWMSLLLGLPADVLSRVIARRPAVELHRLRRDRPAAGRLELSIRALFGRG